MAKDKGLTLYEHVEALAVVDAWFDEAMPDIQRAEGEVPEALAALLDMASGDFNDKAERVALKVNQYLVESAAIQAEATRLAQRAKTRLARADYLKRYLHLCLTKAKVQKVNGLLVNIRIQKSPPSVRVLVTPSEEFAEWRHIIAVEPAKYSWDKAAILAEWKAGRPVPPTVDVEQNTHLRID